MKWRTIHRWWVRIGSVALIVFLAWNLIAFQAWGVPDSSLLGDGCIAVEESAQLILFGTTHPRDRDLSKLAIPVTKILATRDRLASPARARENAARLPPGTEWVLIEGGNHSQFGHYGFQFGDRLAAISRDQQQRELVAAVVRALRSGDLSGDAAEQAGRQ